MQFFYLSCITAAIFTVGHKTEIISLLGDADRSVRQIYKIFNERHAHHPYSIICGTVNKINNIFNETGVVSRKEILRSK